MLSRHKYVKVLLLQFLSDFLGNLRGGRSAEDGSKARGSAINKFNTSLPEDDIIGSTQPDIILRGFFLLGIKIWLLDIPYGFNDFFSEEGYHPGIKGWPQIGQVVFFSYRRWEHVLTLL
ncbi:hypothetical protein ES703_105228 [subsurface metagenome]